MASLDESADDSHGEGQEDWAVLEVSTIAPKLITKKIIPIRIVKVSLTRFPCNNNVLLWFREWFLRSIPLFYSLQQNHSRGLPPTLCLRHFIKRNTIESTRSDYIEFLPIFDFIFRFKTHSIRVAGLSAGVIRTHTAFVSGRNWDFLNM